MVALRYGQSQKVWDLLSKPTQKKLIQQMSDQSKLKASNPPADDPPLHPVLDLQLDWSFESPFGQKGRLINTPHSTSTQKWVQVVYRHQTLIIPVVLENQEWKVDLLATQIAPPS